MTQTPLLPAGGRSPADQAAEASGTKIYAPRSGFQWRAALVFICIGLFGIFPLKGCLDWFSGGPAPNSKTLMALVFCVIVPFCALVILIMNAVRGLPRLTVTSQGVTVKTSLGMKWADWDSVGPFAIKTVLERRIGKPIQAVSARVVGSHANASSRRRKLFSVPDQFQEPIQNILEDLNAARARTVGITEPEPSEASFGLARFRLPWLTFALLAVLVIIFLMEGEFAIIPGVRSTPSLATLFALGALSSKAVISDGQWYRLFTAPLLHASEAHIASNGVAFLMCGWLLERLVGRLWFFAFFVLGALGGSLMSLAVGTPDQISVGASGAIMGLFAALLMGSFRLAPGTRERARMQVLSAQVLFPSLLPLFAASSSHIDYGAHIGGALSGAIVVAILRNHWPETERIPQFRKVAAAVSIVGAILFVAGACMVIVNYPTYRAAAARPALPPHPNPFPAWQPSAVPPANPSMTKTQSDAALDHGPGRVACDLQWSQGAAKAADSYPEFLRDCMRK